MSAFVVDTNVPVVANNCHEKAKQVCVETCIQALVEVRNEIVLIDDQQMILKEYRRQLTPRGQPGPGSQFFLWLWENQNNTERCLQVSITSLENETVFREFPTDPDLSTFDEDDRKFVAVSVASHLDPIILNASDRDWWDFRDILERNGVKVRFLCLDLMEKRGE